MQEVFSDLPNAALLVGLLLTLPGLFIALGSVVVGPIIDRRGRLRTLFIGLVIYAVAGTSGLYLDNIWLLLAGRGLLGVGVAMIMTVVVTLAGDYFEGAEQKSFVGIQGVFMAAGGVVFVLLGGFLADVGWRMPFAVYGASILVLVVGFRTLKEPDRSQVQEGAAEGGGWTWVHRVLYLTAILSIIVFYTMPLQVPYLVKELGITENKYGGIALALVMMGGAISGLFYKRLRMRFSAPTLLFFTMLFMGVGLVFTHYADTYLALLQALFVAGLAAGLLMPNLSNWILEMTAPAIRGKAVGLMTSMIFLGQFLSPFVSNPLKQAFGITAGLQIIGIASMLLSVLFIIFHKPLSTPVTPMQVAGQRQG